MTVLPGDTGRGVCLIIPLDDCILNTSNTIEGKILTSLERLSQIIRVLLWEKNKSVNLSPIQIQFLLYIYLHPDRHCTVSQLAERFQLTKATISDAINALVTKKLIEKKASLADRRVIQLHLTPGGHALASQLVNWSAPIAQALSGFSTSEQTQLYKLLLKLIDGLERKGVMSRSGICLNCQYFQSNPGGDPQYPHYCNFLQRALSNSELKIDCPDHEPFPA